MKEEKKTEYIMHISVNTDNFESHRQGGRPKEVVKHLGRPSQTEIALPPCCAIRCKRNKRGSTVNCPIHFYTIFHRPIQLPCQAVVCENWTMLHMHTNWNV